MKLMRGVVGGAMVLAGVLSFPGGGLAQTTGSQTGSAQKGPVMDGGAGPCSLQLTVTTSDGKPVYAASVSVHISYGFAGVRRLDLSAGTGEDGKVEFRGLPSRVRRPPLVFQGAKDPLSGTVTYDPAKECQAKHDLVLDVAKPQSSK